MKRTIAVSIVLVACGKAEDKAQDKPVEPAPKTVVEPKEPPKKVAETTAASFGKTAGLFGKLAPLKWGMSEADAKAALPTPADPDNALAFKLEYDMGRLVRIKVTSTEGENVEKLTAAAWGAGIVRKGEMGEDTYWFSPATHTRVIGDNSELEIGEYIPLEEFLGPDKVNVAAFPKPLWGTTLEDLQATYGDRMKPDDKLLHIYFPPLEYDHEHLSVFVIHSERRKKTDNVSFEVADGPDKQTTFAAFEKKWGKPKMLKSYGSDDETAVFHSKNPLIEVRRSVRAKSWDVSIRPKDDACGGPCYKGL